MAETTIVRKRGIEIQVPPNRLKSKARPISKGELNNRLTRADQTIKNMQKRYKAQFNSEMADLWDEVRCLKREYTQSGYSTDRLENVFRFVHNMRGQAATFGFPLITEVGTSFCSYILATEDPQDLNLMLLEEHINVLEVIRREQIVGKGDAMIGAVMQALREAVAVQTAQKAK